MRTEWTPEQISPTEPDSSWEVASPGDITGQQYASIISAATGRPFQVERYDPVTGSVEVAIDNGASARPTVVTVDPRGNAL